MRRIFAFLFFIGPRLGFLIYWIEGLEYFNQVFKTWLWPLLGLAFLPWTAFAVALVYGYNAIAGSDWLFVGIAFALDLATYGLGIYYRVKGAEAFSLSRWIQRSRPVRIILYLITFVLGLLTALFVVFAALFDAYPITLEHLASTLVITFLIYLFLGFLTVFTNLAKPWLPAVLLGAPAVLLLTVVRIEANVVRFVYYFTTLGAAVLGAYLAAILQGRSTDNARES